MNITIIGAAKSGLAAALLAKELGHNVFLTESKEKELFADAFGKLTEAGIESEFYANTEKALEKSDCIITSPGVPPAAWIIQEAERRGLPIISELEFARKQCQNNPLIAITGTNGKTTTTALTAFILNQAGKKAVTCGNIGTPLSALVKDITPDTILVLEASSFQLDRIVDFRPDVAMILNITPDHLSYHGSMEKYIEAKFKISMNQNEKDLLILNADDAVIGNRLHGNVSRQSTVGGKLSVDERRDLCTRGNIAYFSMLPVEQGIWKSSDKMVVRFLKQHKEEEIMLLEDIFIPGIHNIYNSMAAAIAARAFEIRNENIRDSLMRFEGVEHRNEFVRNIDGVDYINDSKGTNVNSTMYALLSFKKPIVWIAGGRGDNNNYYEIEELVRERVKCIIAIGEEADAIFNYFCTMKRCIKEDSLEDAVSAAREFAENGDVVLFSPACKSFDMFVNFEHRGEVFKEIVNSVRSCELGIVN